VRSQGKKYEFREHAGEEMTNVSAPTIFVWHIAAGKTVPVPLIPDTTIAQVPHLHRGLFQQCIAFTVAGVHRRYSRPTAKAWWWPP
jgi:hypothetical protein